VTGPARPRFVLASASPRRLALLEQIGLQPDLIWPADLDETPKRNEPPRVYASRIALAKATAASAGHPGAVCLGADTVVTCGRRILPKAETEADARACLALLSGRAHQVLTAVAVVRDGVIRQRVSLSRVAFRRMSGGEIDGYIASEEWCGKAGGYAIQGRAGAWVRRLNGSYSGVVGLPLFETAALLGAAGVGGQ
jgi:septum formation protein